jgi:glycosyltransferase involved in cell wall biosynthesis
MIYLIDLESVETRYTSEWKDHFPMMLAEHNIEVQEVVVIDGPEDIAACTTPGAFLNFSGTNVYKAEQVRKVAELFTDNKVKEGDHFLFADAWHPGIINLKYMSELLGIKVKIHALWHAGSYDPQDFLGRLIGKAKWVRHTEKAFFHAIDYNYFATNFHIEMFMENLLEEDPRSAKMHYMPSGKITRAGWPMEYIFSEPKQLEEKKDLILFPHRLAPEKQLDIFKDLAKSMPQYEWVVCQEQELTKAEYYKLLAQAKIVFSANLQETLGISCYEILANGGIPMVPDRLSYTEMYDDVFRYPSQWTSSMKGYILHKSELISSIENYMTCFNKFLPHIKNNLEYLNTDFFSGTNIYNNMRG